MRLTPMATPHVGESIDVKLSHLVDQRTGEAITGATVAVTIEAPSGANPTASASEEDDDGVYWSTFVPAVEGEHVVKTQATSAGRIFRHREIVPVQPW